MHDAQQTTAQPIEAPEPLRLLVIDDDAAAARLAQRALTRAGYGVERAGDHRPAASRRRSLIPRRVLPPNIVSA